jgi:hypothetical protein
MERHRKFGNITTGRAVTLFPFEREHLWNLFSAVPTGSSQKDTSICETCSAPFLQPTGSSQKDISICETCSALFLQPTGSSQKDTSICETCSALFLQRAVRHKRLWNLFSAVPTGSSQTQASVIPVQRCSYREQSERLKVLLKQYQLVFDLYQVTRTLNGLAHSTV